MINFSDGCLQSIAHNKLAFRANYYIKCIPKANCDYQIQVAPSTTGYSWQQVRQSGDQLPDLCLYLQTVFPRQSVYHKVMTDLATTLTNRPTLLHVWTASQPDLMATFKQLVLNTFGDYTLRVSLNHYLQFSYFQVPGSNRYMISPHWANIVPINAYTRIVFMEEDFSDIPSVVWSHIKQQWPRGLLIITTCCKPAFTSQRHKIDLPTRLIPVRSQLECDEAHHLEHLVGNIKQRVQEWGPVMMRLLIRYCQARLANC